MYPDGFHSENRRAVRGESATEIAGNVPIRRDHRGAGGGARPDGQAIVYTSGDSVFQIAAHKDVVPLPTLYGWSRVARRLLTGEHTVGRVIARPFRRGPAGAFVRSPSGGISPVPPPGPTVLDQLHGRRRLLRRREDPGHLLGSRHHGGALLGFQRPRSGADARVPASPGSFVRLREPGGLRLEVRAPQRPRRLRGGDRGVRSATPGTDRRPGRWRPVHHRRPRLRPDDSLDRSHEGANAAAGRGLPGGPFEIGTRGSFGDLGHTIAALLGVEVEGLEGESFADRIGFRSDVGACRLEVQREVEGALAASASSDR